MRLWSLHPSYLDQKGLVALWREGLLALHVLSGKTRGYTHHPQLIRFRTHDDPVLAVAKYLHGVADEADRRGYHFLREKLPVAQLAAPLTVTTAQLAYELAHLKKKLLVREPTRLSQLPTSTSILPHPFFTSIPGEIEHWEKQ